MKLNKVELKNYTNTNIQKIVTEDEYNIEYKEAITLLSSNRIDILIKYLYAQSILNKKTNDFHVELYLEHIKAFNYFVEADDTNKIGKEDFLENFKNLIHSINSQGLISTTAIPIDKNNIPLDGAHRIAIGMALNIQIPTFTIQTKNTHNFNYHFFINRNFDSKLLDYLSIEYAKLKKNTFMILIWPKAQGHDEEIMKLLNYNGNIIYEKKIKMTYNGIVNLQIVTYQHEPWLGGYHNDFEGAHTKASQCYDNNGYLRVFLFESNANLIKMKDEIRSIFNIEKHAVHINDTQKETIEIANLVFNDNNIHQLNCNTRKTMENFNRLFHEFVFYLNKNNISKEEVAIIGGTLALYGVKDVKDIDYITTTSMPEVISKEIELETKKTNYTHYGISRLINDPKLYLRHQNVKFISLDVLYEIKSNRNNDSDKHDVNIIKKLIDSYEIKYSLIEKLQVWTSISFYRRNMKLFLLKIRFILYKYLKEKK